MKRITILLTLLFFVITLCKGQTSFDYYKLGVLNDSLGQYKKAFKYYSLAIKKSPDNPDYLVKRANIRFKLDVNQNTQKDMFLDLNNAINLEPKNYQALYWRAFWLYKFIPNLNDDQKAINELTNLAKLYPEKAETYRLIGEIGIRKRDTILAYENYHKLLELVSNKSEVYNEMADFEFIYGFYKNAISHYLLGGTRSNFRNNNLAMSYWKLGEKDNACHIYIEDQEPKLMDEFNALIDYCKNKK